MKRAALLLVALALSGCTGASVHPGAPIFGRECPPPQASAQWIQPGLFEAVGLALDAHPELRLDKDLQGISMPDSPMLAEWPGARVVAIRREWDGTWVRADTWRPGEVQIEMPYAEDADAVARLGETLDALGLAGSAERPAWERALLATRGQGPYLHTTLVGAPDIDGLLSRLGHGNLTEDRISVGSFSLTWREWLLHAMLPTHVVEAGNESEPMVLSVDALDRASMWASIPAGAPAFEALRSRGNETFDALGVPRPTFAGATGGSGGCGFGP